MRKMWLLLLSVVVLLVAALHGCSEDPQAADDDDDDGVSGPGEPPAECLADTNCQTDVDCAPLGGHRCNLALSPPRCQKLYCGPSDTWCSSDEVCEQGLQCYKDVCSVCDVCGYLCEVDFKTDPMHCGGCDQPVPAGQICVDGAPGCDNGKALCDDRCVDLSSDPAHCGQCNNPVPPGLVCVDGVPGCASPLSLCGDSCVDLATDTSHCGGCDAVCPPPTPIRLSCHSSPLAPCYGACGCNDGSCLTYLISLQQVTCASLCSQQGLSCTEATWAYAGSGGQCHPGTCSGVPPDLDPRYHSYDFYAVECECTF